MTPTTRTRRELFRRDTTYSHALGGGLYATVVAGRPVSVGIEPLGELIVEADGTTTLNPDGIARTRPWRRGRVAAALCGVAVLVGVLAAHNRP